MLYLALFKVISQVAITEKALVRTTTTKVIICILAIVLKIVMFNSVI